MVAIKAFAQLLPERLKDEAFLEKFSTLVDGEVERINTTIGGLLSYARNEQVEFELVNVHEAVQASVDLLSAEFRKKRVEVRFRLDAKRDAIEGHAGQLRQIFVNLLLNANDAIKALGTIEVASRVLDQQGNLAFNGSVKTKGNLLEVTVSDNGEGISAKEIRQVLMPFFTTKKGGTGLGLSLTSSLVSQHHGTIEIESSPNQGTTVTLRFPLIGETIAPSARIELPT